MIGSEIYALAEKLWPINRSITGDGVRQTLSIIKDECLPNLKIHEVATGTRAFDWTVPKEWRVRDAYIVTPRGETICQFSRNNLHLVGYSVPANVKLSLDELNGHLYSLPDQPSAIPYVTSYYTERWGFCLSENQRSTLEDGTYEVVVDSELFEGSLTYGEVVIPGSSHEEILLSTYVCHPSMANNELSGPAVTAHLGRWLASLQTRRYSYRIVFVPETIGAIVFLSRNIDHLKKNVVAGFNISCVGDERSYSYLPSRSGVTISDEVARHVLQRLDPMFRSYNWADRGSDERQYCAPGVDLPVASIMRTKYGAYPEYHTSLDRLGTVVTREGLEGGFRALKLAIEALENYCRPRATVLCEPQLGRRGLYPTLSTKDGKTSLPLVLDLLTWADGHHSLVEIAEKSGVSVWELYPLVQELRNQQILETDF